MYNEIHQTPVESRSQVPPDPCDALTLPGGRPDPANYHTKGEMTSDPDEPSKHEFAQALQLEGASRAERSSSVLPRSYEPMDNREYELDHYSREYRRVAPGGKTPGLCQLDFTSIVRSQRHNDRSKQSSVGSRKRKSTRPSSLLKQLNFEQVMADEAEDSDDDFSYVSQNNDLDNMSLWDKSGGSDAEERESDMIDHRNAASPRGRRESLKDRNVGSGEQFHKEGQQKIFVMKTNNDKLLGRKFDKVAYCPYCSKAQSKLPRHLRTHHKEEPDVVKLLKAESQKEQLHVLTMIRNRGNHLHNYDVMEKGEGQLIVVSRPDYNADPNDYQPCCHCLGWFVRKAMWKHKCVAKGEEEEVEERGTKRPRCRFEGKFLLPSAPDTDREVLIHDLLTGMRDDDIKICIANDELLIEYAELSFMQVKGDDQLALTRNKVRELARLVLEFRRCSNDESASLASLLNPSDFSVVVKAVKALCGFDQETRLYSSTNLALKLGTALKQTALILLNKALKDSDGDSTREQLEKFISHLGNEWEKEIARDARNTLDQARRKKPQLLPLANDVVAMSRFLENNAEICLTQLAQDGADTRTLWNQFSQYTLAHLIAFNRKRQGVASRLTIKDYGRIKKGETPVTEGQVDLPDKFEQELSKVLWRVDLVQEHGETVPVLMTGFDKSCLDALMMHREQAGVSSQNEYLFATSDSSHLDGTQAFRDFTDRCGAKYPHMLQSTLLSEEVATMTQVMSLRSSELDALTKCIGQDVKIYPDFSRLPSAAVQVARISKILLDSNGGGDDLTNSKALEEFKADEGTVLVKKKDEQLTLDISKSC